MTKAMETLTWRNLADQTIGQVLSEHYHGARFRTAFLSHPVLTEWTVKSVLSSSDSFDAFLDACRTLPQFGRTQETRLISVLMDLQHKLGLLSADFSPEAYRGRKTLQATVPAQALDLGDAAPITLTGEFYPDYVSAWRAVYQRAWRLAHFEEFVYIPTSMPEFAKHPEVLRAEIGPEVDLGRYLAENAGLRQSLSALKSSSGLILIDRARLELLLHRQGPYAGLSEATVTEQRRMLFDLLADFPAGIETRVCDVETARLSSGSVIGELIILSAMGGYVVTQNGRFRATILERCRSAADRSPTLAEYLAAAISA